MAEGSAALFTVETAGSVSSMTRSDQPGPPIAGLPAHERLRLAAVVTGRSQNEMRRGVAFTSSQQVRFDQLVTRRLSGEPLQYLEGTVVFGPVELAVDERVLIPRPETEYLFELVSQRPAPSLVVDLCTGSGALALALKKTFPAARVVGTDISPAAVDVARANGAAHGLLVDWFVGDLFEAIPAELAGKVDLLVANPPYVAEDDWARLPPDVQREPRLALVAGPRGIEAAEKVLAGVGTWLAPTGEAWVEVGEDQARALAEQFSDQVVIDQYGRERFVRVSRG